MAILINPNQFAKRFGCLRLGRRSEYQAADEAVAIKFRQ